MTSEPSSRKPFHVAIVGGGLCGIALAIGLQNRQVPFTIFESRASFTEIGAGINLSPPSVEAFRLLDPSLGEAIYQQATRNPPPSETVWMHIHYAAASGEHEDGELLGRLLAPPTGNMSVHRQEFLGLLMSRISTSQVRFDKKLASYEQDDDSVTLKFTDGTEEAASVLVGCDGIHSQTRKIMSGEDSILSRPHFNGDGCYRAVLPIETVVEAVGESGRESQILLGPNGYMIMYPVNGGEMVNCGAWFSRRGSAWDHATWVLPNQAQQFALDRQGWGRRASKILALFDANPAFWAAHQHIHQPDQFYDGRVVLIGDAAHAMPPHQGAGAGQAAEDACILAEVLTRAHRQDSSSDAVAAALRVWADIRVPRFLGVQRISSDAGWDWTGFLERRLEGHEREDWLRTVQRRFEWIRDVDMAHEVDRTRRRMDECFVAPAM